MNRDTDKLLDDANSKRGELHKEPSSRRFRWRLIPVATFGLIGCLALGAGLFAGVIMAYIAITGQPLYEPGPTKVDIRGLATMFGSVAIGLVFIYSAIQWWRGYWMRAVLVVLVCVGVGKVIELVANAFNSTAQHVEHIPADRGLSRSVQFYVPETNLTVKLPHVPTSEHLEPDTELGVVNIELYQAEQTIPGSELMVFYSVGIIRYTDEFIDGIASAYDGDFLQGLALGGIRKRPGSKVVAREETVLNGLPGLVERIVMPGGRTEELRDDMPVVVYRHYYQEKERVYLFQILTLETLYETAPNDFNRIAEEFFSSIGKQTLSEAP
ncbi:hypothetical protein Pla144_10360 [Bythopirellula polymerisocia]|uniref:Uncharacterized protein n=1 Tax=Bythopirellula polymerisocia TaxID=2528003 RepID=A0A5C6D070_9BACT|nr:hypothetical protein Pla144_10360 [Bythopirellula polymerisocia]